MDIERFGPDDTQRLGEYLDVTNAARAVDAPWLRPATLRGLAGRFRYGWDLEAEEPFLGREGGVPVAVGTFSASEYDNLHLAWVGVAVHPDHRRRGHGTAMLEALAAETRARGRTTIGTDGWDDEGTRAFAARHGLALGSVAVQRCQVVAEVEWSTVERLHAEAAGAASAYELLHRVGRTPDHELEALAELTAAINDAPTDDLDLDDEAFPPERVRAYEDAWLARGHRLHRVLARHRATGALAGHTVVVVDDERPELGSQHDTAVAGAHRGHRLGVLLKTDMLRRLREAEPQLAEISTWNAESNDHMIGVNELLGYRVMGRELQFQKQV